MSRAPWTPRIHRPLREVAQDLYCVDAQGSPAPLGRRMTIVRLSNGDLVLQSVVTCDEPTLQAIEALGRMAFLIVPNPYHRMDAPAYHERYPEARVLAPPGARARAAQVVPIDGDVSTLPVDPRLSWQALDGVRSEGVFVHRDDAGDATLIFTDVLFNLPERIPGFGGWILKVLGSSGGPKVTRIARTFMVSDRRAYANQLRALAALPKLSRIIPSHGAILEQNVSETLRQVATDLER